MMNNSSPCDSQELGMPKMPIQHWTNIYDLRTGLKSGTIFPDLNKPFHMGGVTVGR